jgi:hypothetical protein
VRQYAHREREREAYTPRDVPVCVRVPVPVCV